MTILDPVPEAILKICPDLTRIEIEEGDVTFFFLGSGEEPFSLQEFRKETPTYKDLTAVMMLLEKELQDGPR